MSFFGWLAGIAFAGWFACGFRSSLQVQSYTVADRKIPRTFDGFKLIQLSDLHSCPVAGLEEAIDRQNPDFIVCTGDIFDGVQNPDEAYRFLKRLQEKYPVCFVTGNHEIYLQSWPYWKKKVKELGITVLESSCLAIRKEDDVLEIAGIDDPGTHRNLTRDQFWQQFTDRLNQLPAPRGYRILLFHRASCLNQIRPEQADLVLAGHLHGGQWRIFGIPVAGPGNFFRIDLFPSFSSGQYQRNGQTWIVSRGLGDKMKIPRFYNRPNLPVIILRHLERNQTDA